MFGKHGKTLEQRIGECLDGYLGARDWPVTVKVVDGTAIFAGEVPTGVERRILEEQALAVPGVTDVDTRAVLLTQEDGVMNCGSAPEPLRLPAVALARFRDNPLLADEVFDVDEQDTVLELCGSVTTREARDEALRVARGVPGVSAVSSDLLEVAPRRRWPVEPEPQGERSYRVAEGDTLERIALRFYGSTDAAVVARIARANGMADPRHPEPGILLELPAVGAGP